MKFKIVKFKQKFEYLKIKNSFWKEIKKKKQTFFLVSKLLSFTHKNQSSKNILDIAF